MQSKIVKAGITYTICNILLKGISFLTVPLFIRLLTTDEFGRYNVFISIEGIIYIFSGLTIHASIKNAFYDYRTCYAEYVKNCVYLDFFNSLLILCVGLVAGYFFQNEIGLSYIEIVLLVIGGFCNALTNIYTSKLVMEYKANNFMFVSFLAAITSVCLSLLFIFTVYADDHYFGRVLGGICSQVLVSIFIIFLIFKDGFSSVNIKQWRYGLKISLPIIPHGLSQMILSTSNRILIKYIYTASKAGLYSFTYTISLAPQLIFSSISNVWEPWFFEKMDSGDTKSIKKSSTMFCLLISISFILFSCLIPELVKIFATEEYYEIIDISIIVMMGVYFATLYYIPCEVEYFYKKTTYIAGSTLTCAIFNLTLNIILMQFFSYKVAAYVTLISYFLYFAFHMCMTYVITKQMIFDLKRMVFIILVSVFLMSLSVVFLNSIIIRSLIFFAVLLFLTIHFKSFIRSTLEKYLEKIINSYGH